MSQIERIKQVSYCHTYRILQNQITLHYNNRPHTFVALVPINNSLHEDLLYWVVLQRIRRRLPLGMSEQLLRCHIVLPFLALEDPEKKTCVIVVAVWDRNIVLLAILSECFQL